MRRATQLLFVTTLLVGCASSQTPAQREMQAQVLRENGTRLKLVANGASKADVQNLVGIASPRQIYREGGYEIEIWTYGYDEGFARLKFRDGKLAEQKTQRTRLTFARDITIPLAQKDMEIHLGAAGRLAIVS